MNGILKAIAHMVHANAIEGAGAASIKGTFEAKVPEAGRRRAGKPNSRRPVSYFFASMSLSRCFWLTMYCIMALSRIISSSSSSL